MVFDRGRVSSIDVSHNTCTLYAVTVGVLPSHLQRDAVSCANAGLYVHVLSPVQSGVKQLIHVLRVPICMLQHRNATVSDRASPQMGNDRDGCQY